MYSLEGKYLFIHHFQLISCDLNNLVFISRFGIPFGIPKAEQLTVVFGEPIDVPCEGDNIKPESVDKYHALYLQKLEELFDRHKDAEGYGHRKLKIL